MPDVQTRNYREDADRPRPGLTMRQYVMAITLLMTGATLAHAQTCAPGDPPTALGTYCKSDFDGGKIIAPAAHRTPPPSPLDVPDPRLTPGVTNPRVTQAN